jgi:DNA-binding NtrC family response regulator
MMKILVVDDDKDMCEILSDFLKDEGHTVLTAYDGESALDSVKSRKYDVLILDYRLQGIDGLHVLEKVHQIDESLITIMISAFGSEQMKRQAKKLGAYDFIEKPFDMERIVRIVKQALSQEE